MRELSLLLLALLLLALLSLTLLQLILLQALLKLPLLNRILRTGSVRRRRGSDCSGASGAGLAEIRHDCEVTLVTRQARVRSRKSQEIAASTLANRNENEVALRSGDLTTPKGLVEKSMARRSCWWLMDGQRIKGKAAAVKN